MSDQNLKLPIFPTGKQHVSFSELACWIDCPFRHKLVYIDKVGSFDGNEHTFFGTHVHFGCESFVKSGNMPVDEVAQLISDTWTERSFSDKDTWIAQATAIVSEVPEWMNTTYDGWEPIGAEIPLFEPLDHLGHTDVSWKGYIDAAIKHKNSRGIELTRIIDWKTTVWGWRKDKLRDFKTNAQAASYKIFWARKFDVPMTSIRTNFVLLKRQAKQGERCQSVEVSVGPDTASKVEKTIDKMVRAVKAGHHQKNKLSCRYCEFNATQHCEGVGNNLR